jgi:hypothetical protein
MIVSMRHLCETYDIKVLAATALVLIFSGLIIFAIGSAFHLYS